MKHSRLFATFKFKWLLQLSFFLLFGVGFFSKIDAQVQAPPASNFVRHQIFSSYAAFKDTLESLGKIEQQSTRDSLINLFWASLKTANQIPFAFGDSVAFLYRGSVNQTAWRGDFNGWIISNGTKVGNSNIWILEHKFPSNARIDYKVFLNNNNWILDPNNPLQIWSGFGPNSELRMPDYLYPQITVKRHWITGGTLSLDIRIASSHLGYTVNYRVYLPRDYNRLRNMPVIYVTDGHEYLADFMGSMVVVMDNLIADGLIEPLIAVFIDPRQVGNPGNNRRASEYVANANFANFVAEELVAKVDSTYKTRVSAKDRAILGTSLGGLNAAYFGATKPDTFQKIAIQSPAFQVWPQIYDLYMNTTFLSLKIFMSNGTINDGNGGATLSAILSDKGYTYRYIEVNEGHSWGNWRALLDDALVYLFGTQTSVQEQSENVSTIPHSLQVYPNPAKDNATFEIRLSHSERVSLTVYNLLGQQVTQLFSNKLLQVGTHVISWSTLNLPNGVYVYQLLTESGSTTGRLTLMQ